MFSETLRDHVVFSRMLSHGFIDGTHGVGSSAALQILDVLLVEVTSSHVLVCAAIASFSGGDSVAFGPEVHSETSL